MNTNSTAAESQEVTATEVAHAPAPTHVAAHVPAHAPAQVPAQVPPEAPQAQAAAAQPAAASPRALLKQLQQQFPAFRQCLPLEIGIDKQLLGRLPGLDRKIMRAALGIHTGSLRYLKAMEKATVRYDLDGKPGAEVTDTHRAHAKEVLQQRFKKEAERKRAEREAAAAEEAARLRQEKLQALASKFSRS